MDAKSDVDFDAYWEEEARNPNRNRIRIGRQYQAQVPALLKAGESDGRLPEDLETLAYNPHNSLSDRELDQFFAIAKAIGLFVQAVDSCQEGLNDGDEDHASGEDNDLELQKSWQILDAVSARNFLGDHSNSHASSHGNNAAAASAASALAPGVSASATPGSPGSSAATASGGASANNAGGSAGNTSATTTTTTTPEKFPSITTRHQRLQQQKEQQINLDGGGETGSMISTASSSTLTANASSPLPLSPLKPTTNTRILNAMKGLSSFISAHHPEQQQQQQQQQRDSKRCKIPAAELAECQPIDLHSGEKHDTRILSKMLLDQWSPLDERIFGRALQVCGKNFSAIKKDYLPWKSVRSIIDYYYTNIDKEAELLAKKKVNNTTKPNNNRHNFDKPNKSPMDESKRGNKSGGGGSKQTTGEGDDQAAGNNNNNTESGDNNETAAGSSGSGSGSGGQGGNGNTDTDAGTNNPNECSSDAADLSSSHQQQLTKNNAFLGIPKNNYLNELLSNLFSSPNPNNNNNNNNENTNNNNNNKHEPKLKNGLIGKAKPVQETKDKPNGDNSGSLGSLNLYLHGNLVVKLNAQQQESGPKWIESPDLPAKKRSMVTTNGTPIVKRYSSHHRSSHHHQHKGSPSLAKHFSGSPLSLTSSTGTNAVGELAEMSLLPRRLFNGNGEDSSSDKAISPSSASNRLRATSPSDGFSAGGGDSDDDDSITSNESSSLVASSPSSTSTSVTTMSAAKKARVKVENLNGNFPIHEREKQLSAAAAAAGELELKKKILEANLNLIFSNSLVSSMFEPPRAHSSSSSASPPAAVSQHFFPGPNPTTNSSSSSSSPSSASSWSSSSNSLKASQQHFKSGEHHHHHHQLNGTNGSNGMLPVDLTRKSITNNGDSNGLNALLSPRLKHPVKGAAGRVTPSSSPSAASTSSSSSSSLFSLPALPGLGGGKRPLSPNSLRHGHKKSSYIRATSVAAASPLHK